MQVKLVARRTGRPASLAIFVTSLAAATSCGAPKPATVPPPEPRSPAQRTQAEKPEAELAFSVREGATDNHFYRRGPIAAHLLATSGPAPRLVVAFPAGNTGAGLWFEGGDGGANLTVEGPVAPVENADGMRGVQAVLHADVPSLRTSKIILGSNWSLREWVPPGLTFPPLEHDLQAGPPARIHRTTIDGRQRIEVLVQPLDSGSAKVEEDALVVRAPPGSGSTRFRVVVATDEEPLHPIPMGGLLEDASDADPALLRTLAFLSYEEKLVAGSWRFLTYFGRDTLLTLQMLMPAASPELIEAGLASVIDRLGPQGRVAHYEEIGEFAALRNHSADPPPANPRKPFYEYRMVDDDFLLAPVLASYLSTPAGRERAERFLSRRTPAGESYVTAVRRNLEHILAQAAPYADEPTWRNLISLRDDYPWGEWRDSDEGLGEGTIPFNVNAALVPAALDAAAMLYRLAELGADEETAARAESMGQTWETAASHFQLELDGPQARSRAVGYARQLGLGASEVEGALDDPLQLAGIALDDDGSPIPIQHSDDSFVLMFRQPPDEYLVQAARRIRMPFPAGLRTPVGIVVANPAYAGEDLRRQFTTAHYHGTVVWSWQQAMLAAGIRRQLERRDLGGEARAALERAQRALWEVISATRRERAGELWTFAVRDGEIALVPFDHDSGSQEESNAAQLWSTVYLAIEPPGEAGAEPSTPPP